MVELVPSLLRQELAALAEKDERIDGRGRWESRDIKLETNCLYNAEDYDRAKEFFLEAIGVEADCIEAIYNLGLVYKRLNYYNESL